MPRRDPKRKPSTARTRAKRGAVAPPPKRPPNRAGRAKDRTRHKLIAAAERVISQKGMESATITEIAEVADLGVGTFYNHFKSKDEIARTVFSAHLEELAATFDKISKSEPDVAQAIAFIQKVFMEKAMRDPLWGWFAIHAEFALQHMDETFGARAAMDFQRGLAQGRFSFTAIDCAVTLTLAALFGTLRRILDGRASPIAAIDMVEFNLRMYGVPTPEAKKLANQPLPAWIFAEP